MAVSRQSAAELRLWATARAGDSVQRRNNPPHAARCLQMNFAGLQDTKASYADKLAYQKQLRQQYGL